MKITQISQGDISLKIELDSDERENIKEELDNNLDELQNASRKVTFDRFLAELKEAL